MFSFTGNTCWLIKSWLRVWFSNSWSTNEIISLESIEDRFEAIRFPNTFLVLCLCWVFKSDISILLYPMYWGGNALALLLWKSSNLFVSNEYKASVNEVILLWKCWKIVRNYIYFIVNKPAHQLKFIIHRC